MEHMPFQAANEVTDPCVSAGFDLTVSDWRAGLPALRGRGITLRELRLSDAPALFAMLTSEEVARFISPPPKSIQAFERFILWTQRQREAGEYVCFGIVPDGLDTAVGLFQIRGIGQSVPHAEWGFALGSPFWGTGLFVEGARLTLDFAFKRLGLHRLEARAAVRNGRGNGALRKLGAVMECVMRQSLIRNGEALDQVLWSMLAEDWARQSDIVWADPPIELARAA